MSRVAHDLLVTCLLPAASPASGCSGTARVALATASGALDRRVLDAKAHALSALHRNSTGDDERASSRPLWGRSTPPRMTRGLRLLRAVLVSGLRPHAAWVVPVRCGPLCVRWCAKAAVRCRNRARIARLAEQ